MATVTLSKPSFKYCTDVRYCLQVETNARSALIGLYCRDVGQIGSIVGNHLKLRKRLELYLGIKDAYAIIVKYNHCAIFKSNLFSLYYDRDLGNCLVLPIAVII